MTGSVMKFRIGYRIAVLLLLAFPVQADSGEAEYIRLTDLFERAMQGHLDTHPESKTYYGIEGDNDKWDDYSEAFAVKDHAREIGLLEELRTIDAGRLPDRGRDQLEVALFYLTEKTDRFKWRHHWYSVSTERTPIQSLTSFLIDFHSIESLTDAEAYIQRVHGFPRVVTDVIDGIGLRADKGIHPPSFSYPKVIEIAEGMLEGAPLDESNEETILLSDFRQKLAKIELAEDEKNRLVIDLRKALTDSYKPAIEKYLSALRQYQKQTNEDDGVWKHPDGAAFYKSLLRRYTTTDLTPDEIHHRGLRETARIHGQIEDIMKQVGFQGSLREFLVYMRDDPRWYFPETDEGREQYLSETRVLVEEMKTKVRDYFNLYPKADVVVRRVEPFREKNTASAYYWAPAIDGSRPGIYYVPLYRMKDNARWDLVTTAYHETLPGHHMQSAIANELEDTPMYVKVIGFTAYSEGWALYSERLASDMGMYEGKPYADFGRLSGELFRAVRLVVDTGIHHKKWTRRQAIDYMLANTSFTEEYVTGQIERYIVWPAQATSYMIGMLTFLDLREWARAELGDNFDIRDYHDVVLSSGELPMPLMEKKVKAWVLGVKQSQ